MKEAHRLVWILIVMVLGAAAQGQSAATSLAAGSLREPPGGFVAS